LPDARFFEALGPAPLSELARLSGAVLPEGADGDRMVIGASVLGRAEADTIGFFFEEQRRPGIASRADVMRESRLGACFVQQQHLDVLPPHCVPLVTPAPQLAWAVAAERLHRLRQVQPGAPAIHPEAELEEGVEIASGAVVGQGAQIGARTVISTGAVIGPGVAVGRDCYVGSNAVVICALLGDRVKIYAGTVIGEAGFGVTAGSRGLVDMPQLGRVILQDGVTVGANSCIDRGAFDDTVVGENTKIDNLVQIAHNVTIGRNCVMAAFTGISGSVKIGDGVQLGGAAGIADHVTIGDGARLAARIGLFKDVPAGESWGGFPGRPAAQWFRETVWLAKAIAPKRKGRAEG
jgi:UDP-3-O-[3-hydroxymyristoyl] glucosamine N-acyltransferase